MMEQKDHIQVVSTEEMTEAEAAIEEVVATEEAAITVVEEEGNWQ